MMDSEKAKYYGVKDRAVQLSQGQSADPGKCGSCHFFERYDKGNPAYNSGACRFRLPPQIEEKHVMRSPDGDWTDIRQCNDTYGCDLYRTAGREYAKIAYWTA